MSTFTALAPLYPSDDTKGAKSEWKNFYNLTIVKCDCCDYIEFAGCRKNPSSFSERSVPASLQSSEQSAVPVGPEDVGGVSDDPSSTEPTSHNNVRACKCHKDRLWTLQLQCENEQVHSFCHAGANSAACNCTKNTQELVLAGCKNCQQTSAPLSLIHLKVTKEEVEYGLASFPPAAEEIKHTLIACKGCGVLGMPGIGGKLTEINGEFDFWTAGDDEYMSRTACNWGLDHTPDCHCKDTQDSSNYVTFRTLLKSKELLYLQRSLRSSLPCVNVKQSVSNLTDMLQTKLALSNNKALGRLQKSNSEEEILGAIRKLSQLLKENRAYFPSQENSFPMMVLSDVESFLRVAKSVKGQAGPGAWTRPVAKAFGKLLRGAKTARKRRASRTSKVVMEYMAMTDMAAGTANTGVDRRARVCSA